MLFPKNYSGMVRLADSVKSGLRYSARAMTRLLEVATPYRMILHDQQRIASEALAGRLPYEEADQQIKRLLQSVPREVGLQIALLDMEQGDHARSTILMCCFSLEAYINSLAHYLITEIDFLGLVRAGRETSAEVLMNPIERMSVREKWSTIARLGSPTGFDTGRAPFQDFSILFRFRDDVVHDKVVKYGQNRGKRYNGKLPDPVLGHFHLGHALYAAQTYWDMVLEIHRILGVDMRDFHRHYNLMPWSDEDERRSLHRLVERYSKADRI